jgi:hypothetical protein
MPFDAHKNPNETIQTRTVVRAPRCEQFEYGNPGWNGDLRLHFWRGLYLLVGQGTAKGSLLNVRNDPFRIRDATFAEQVANRLRHVTANKKQKHGQSDADHEKRAPSKRRNDQQAEHRCDDQPNRKGSHDIARPAAADAAGAKFGSER